MSLTEQDRKRLEAGISYTGRPLYYDRQGKPLGLWAWAEKLDDDDYRTLARQFFYGTLISTIWEGLDHSIHPDGPPIIFETMAFRGRSLEAYGRRYSTEEQALAGQRRAYRHFAWPHRLAAAGGILAVLVGLALVVVL